MTEANNDNTQEGVRDVGSNAILTHGEMLNRIRTYETIIGASDAEFNPEPHRRMDKRFANPAPLGLCAFALTSFVAGMINVNARSVSTPNIVVSLAFFYGGIMMLLAGMWEMAMGSVFGAVTLSSYGGFWLSFGAILVPSFGIEVAYNPQIDGGQQLASAIGFYLIGWFIFSTLMLICTLRSTVEFFLLFVCVDMSFLMLAIGYFRGMDTAFIKAGGGFSIGVAFFGWYLAMAGMFKEDTSFMSLPSFPFPWAVEKSRKKKQSVEKMA